MRQRGRSDATTHHDMRIYEDVERRAGLVLVEPGGGGCFRPTLSNMVLQAKTAASLDRLLHGTS